MVCGGGGAVGRDGFGWIAEEIEVEATRSIFECAKKGHTWANG